VSLPELPAFPTTRLRRLRRTPALRRLVSEVSLRPSDLVLPMFVREGVDEPVAISSMPGVVQHSHESLVKAAAEAVERGVGGLMIFGVPDRKDARGTGADDPDGVLNVALRRLSAEFGEDTVLSTTTRPCIATRRWRSRKPKPVRTCSAPAE